MTSAGKGVFLPGMIFAILSVADAWQCGDFTIELEGGRGGTTTIDASMFDSNGNLNLPPGSSGTITGPGGNTLDFTGLEQISMFKL